MKLLMLTCLTLVLTAGCVTVAAVQTRLDTWRGVDADLLAAQWGAPYGTYDKKDGGRILSYGSSRVVTIGSEEFPRTQSRECRVDVEVGPDNLIRKASFRGALDQCDDLIFPYGGPPVSSQEETDAPSN